MLPRSSWLSCMRKEMGRLVEVGPSVLSSARGPVEQGAGELAGGGGMEGEAAGGEDGALIFACEGEGGDAG